MPFFAEFVFIEIDFVMQRLKQKKSKLKNSARRIEFYFMLVHYAFSSVWIAEWLPFGK